MLETEHTRFKRGTGGTSHESGFTLIISVLISSILLSIGLAMFNISLKEAVLTSTGQESQTSFFAADSGIECIRYWDLPTIPNVFDAQLTGASLQCGNAAGYSNVTVNSSTQTSPNVWTHILTYNIGGSLDECVQLTIVKDTVTQATTIESRGYNTCDSNNPRRTERGIRI